MRSRQKIHAKSLLIPFFLVLLLISGCGKDSKKETYKGYPNVGGGYTLVVSGGTLNDGSGKNGLVVLATLRDENSNGPGLNGGWQITITGPEIVAPLVVDYDDGSSSSYITWWWKGFQPLSGTYTASASNGSVTLTYNFSINASSTLYRPALTKTGTTISWIPISGAGSYYYQVTDGTGQIVYPYSGYLDPTLTSFQLSSSLPDGSYLIEVSAYTKNRLDLMKDPSSWPSLPSQENISVSTMDLVISGGITGSYNLNAKGGVLYEGLYSNGTGTVEHYGLVIWTSILTDTGTLPAGDWAISVIGPNISSPIVFTYPRNHSHYVYWDFGTIPATGNYTVTATTPGYGSPLTANFSLSNTTFQLPLAANIQVDSTTSPTDYIVTWSPVTGASSYYVNVWTVVVDYVEVAGAWVDGNTYTALIPKSKLTSGVSYDVYVTACTLDMTSLTPPSPLPAQVDMSDTTFTYATFTAQ